MERKGGCCLAPRYAAGAQVGHMGRLMLKFRPIAPKPAAMAPAPAPMLATVKGKYKAVAGRRGRKPRKSASTPRRFDMQQVGGKDKPLSSSSSPPPPLPATLPPLMPVLPAEEGFGRAANQVVSSVTVEDVTGIWRDGEAPYAAACGGAEAPTFVSDQYGRVTWTSMAFSRAVSGGEIHGAAMTAPEVRVVLASKDGAPVPAWGTCAGFTSRVRVPYDRPRRGSLVAPCDVWRLDAGGYLWRLDLDATLTLSLGSLL